MHGFAALMGAAALATKEFVVQEQPDANGRYVRIVGRKAGLIDWLFSLLGIDTTTVFEVYDDHILFRHSSLSGSQTSIIPLGAISMTSSGFFKPVLLIPIGLALLPVFLIGVIPLVYYFLNKSLMISVDAHSGGRAIIAFKRSVVEGVRVEPEQADRVVRIINQLMLRRQPARALAAA